MAGPGLVGGRGGGGTLGDNGYFVDSTDNETHSYLPITPKSRLTLRDLVDFFDRFLSTGSFVLWHGQTYNFSLFSCMGVLPRTIEVGEPFSIH